MFFQVKGQFSVVSIFWSNLILCGAMSSMGTMGRALLRCQGWFCQGTRDIPEAFLCTQQQEHHGNTASSNMLWFSWRKRRKWGFGAPIFLSHCCTWCSGQNILFYCSCILNVYKYCEYLCLWFIQFLHHMPDDINSPDWINRIIYHFRSRHGFSVFTKMRYWFPLFVLQLFPLSFFSLIFTQTNCIYIKKWITLIKTLCPKCSIFSPGFALTHKNSSIWVQHFQCKQVGALTVRQGSTLRPCCLGTDTDNWQVCAIRKQNL